MPRRAAIPPRSLSSEAVAGADGTKLPAEKVGAPIRGLLLVRREVSRPSCSFDRDEQALLLASSQFEQESAYTEREGVVESFLSARPTSAL
jgi:hypothetical protein